MFHRIEHSWTIMAIQKGCLLEHKTRESSIRQKTFCICLSKWYRAIFFCSFMNRNSVNSLKMSKASKIVSFLLITQTQKKFLLLQHLRQTSCTRSFSAFWSCANLVEEMNGGTDCVFDEGYHARWGQGPAWNGKASHVPTFWRGQATGAWYDGLLGHQPRWRTKRKVTFASWRWTSCATSWAKQGDGCCFGSRWR